MRKIETKKLAAAVTALALCAGVLTGCGGAASGTASSTAASSASSEASSEEADEMAAKNVADLIDAIYVQERNKDTDAQCEAAKAAWDALTDTQKELVEGENADPDYFGRDTGDAGKDDPRNADDIGENELLVVSFGTSFNGSRAADIKGIEDALQATRAAVEEGIVAGGGTATINAIPAVDKLVGELEGDERTGAKIVRKALEAPLRQIAANAGLEGSVVIDNILKANKPNYGFDAQKEEYVEDMIEAGIVDPTKVTRSALENAASVAAMVLTTESLVADLPEPPAPAAPAPDMGGMY